MQDSKELTERLGKCFSVTDFTVACSGKTDTDADDALLDWTVFLSGATYSHVVVCPGQIDRLALMGKSSAETLRSRSILGYVTHSGCQDSDLI